MEAMMSSKASEMNHIIIKKIGIAMKRYFKEDNVSADDKHYIKYQLLKKHDSYELCDMNIVEFKKEVMEVIRG